MNKDRMPLLFVGHGNPMNVILDNEFTRSWETIGKTLPTPKVIMCMSAHWLTSGTFVTSSTHPNIIYDFYGFPKELYEVTYPVSGDLEAAEEVTATCNDIQKDTAWGIDHGAWTVLKRMFPLANVPVIQLSIDYSRPASEQFEIMKSLKKLREQGVLFVGSGNIVHNLGMVAMNQKPYEWAIEFENKAKELIEKGDINSLLEHQKLGTAARLSIPTDDHYRPLLNTLAMKYDYEEPAFFNQGIDLSSVSMLSFLYK